MKTFNYVIDDESIKDIIPFSQFLTEKNVLIQVFCGQSKSVFQNTIDTICEKLPNATCIGATSDGEIEESKIHVNKTVISISTFKSTYIRASYKTLDSSYQNGVDLSNDIITKKTKLMLFFASLNKTNGDDFLKGVEKVDNSIIIGGGLASTHTNYKNSFVSYGNKLFNKGVVGISLNSDILNVYNEFRFNWLPVGIEHIITKVDNNKVYTIDNMNAVKFYERYLGTEIMESLYKNGTQFSLILLSGDIPIGRVVIDKDDESLTFNGNFKKGDVVKFGFGQADAIMKNPEESYTDLFNNYSESYFIYSCMARRRYLPNHIQLEIEPLSNHANTSGFFTHGEFYHHKNSNKFLNHTLTLIALSESNKEPIKSSSRNTHQVTNDEQTITVRALTSLIEESSKDYYLLYNELEERVKDRTKELEEANDELEQTVGNLKATQKQLVESEKMASLGGLVAGVAHELNTPVGIGITGITHLLKITEELNTNYINNSIGQEDFEQYLQMTKDLSKQINLNLERTAALIRNFKQVAADQTHEGKRNFKFKEYLHQIIYSLNPLIKKSNFEIRIECDEEIELVSYPGVYSQIITNLIDNSIKHAFNNQNKNIVIIESSRTKNNELKLVYKDNGKGVPKKNLSKIFDPFFTTNREKGGTGLGLNIIYNIVTMTLKGSINCQSMEGYGLDIEILLPLNLE